MQQKPNTKLRDLLKNKKAKTRKLSELSKTEQNRLRKQILLESFKKQCTQHNTFTSDTRGWLHSLLDMVDRER